MAFHYCCLLVTLNFFLFLWQFQMTVYTLPTRTLANFGDVYMNLENVSTCYFFDLYVKIYLYFEILSMFTPMDGHLLVFPYCLLVVYVLFKITNSSMVLISGLHFLSIRFFILSSFLLEHCPTKFCNPVSFSDKLFLLLHPLDDLPFLAWNKCVQYYLFFSLFDFIQLMKLLCMHLFVI